MHLNPLDLLLTPPEVDPLALEWGEVTALSPLSVLLDRDDTQPVVGAANAAGPLSVGGRVLVALHKDRAIVLGPTTAASSPTWVSWTPTLTAVITNPTMGNSERLGRYVVRGDGTVSFSAKITIGSTFSVGSGHYMLPLPVPSNPNMEWHARLHVVGASLVGGIGESFGYGKIEDGASVTRMFVRDNSSTATNLRRVDAALGWAAGNRIIIQGEYEQA